jgi:hypothetical protein
VPLAWSALAGTSYSIQPTGSGGAHNNVQPSLVTGINGEMARMSFNVFDDTVPPS